MVKSRKVVYKTTNNKANKKLDNLASSMQKPLMAITSVFPFSFFPDSIVVDKKKVDVIHRSFFATKRVFTIFIDDIRTVRVSNGLFFATIRFEVKGFEQNPQPVKYLRKHEAKKIRDLIIGLVTTDMEDIDISKIPEKQAKKKLTKIGRVLKRKRKRKAGSKKK
jgi:hypothetical protein